MFVRAVCHVLNVVAWFDIACAVVFVCLAVFVFRCIV